MKDATVNKLVDVDKTFKKLPCTDGLILRKLKENLPFKGHVYFKPVSRTKLLNVLIYLNEINPLYYDINVNLLEISNDLMTFRDGSIDFTVHSSTTEPENRAKIQNRTELKF